MAVEILLQRTLRGLEPADDDARDKLKTWKIGQPLKCEVRLARDNSRMRYYWGLVDIILQNIDQTFASKEEVSDSIKLGIGHVEQVQVYDGEKWHITRTPKSISFAKLSEPEFQDFIKRAEGYACAVLSVTSEQLADALTDYLAPGLRREGTRKPMRAA